MAEKNYITARKIATGGMAEVLLAAQTSDGQFAKLVVLKRVLSHLREDGQFVQMFLNEARVAALLNHPNIVRVYDIERWSDELTVVMEYLSGEDLRYVIGQVRGQKRPMDIPIACRVIADAAKGLHYAHTAKDLNGTEMRVIHRDVAPSNLFVTYDGVVKILDFGIAKASTQMSYTIPGTMKGKFAYMAPENIQQEPLDQRTDIFSLGVVLWEMLATRRLFTGKNDAAILKDVLDYEIPPPSVHNSQIPPELDAVTLCCLQREQSRRYTTAAEVAEELENILGKMGEAVPQRELAKWLKELVPWRYHERKELEKKVAKRAAEGIKDAQAPDPSTVFSRDNVPSLFSATAAPSRSTRPGSTSRESAPPAKESNTPLIAMAAIMVVVVLLIVGGLVVVLLGGDSQNKPPPSPTRVAPAAAAQSALVIHAMPSGCLLKIDGQVAQRSVGTEGFRVNERPGKRISVHLSKSGYIDKRSQVVMPSTGVRHLYFNLTRGKPTANK